MPIKRAKRAFSSVKNAVFDSFPRDATPDSREANDTIEWLTALSCLAPYLPTFPPPLQSPSSVVTLAERGARTDWASLFVERPIDCPFILYTVGGTS